MRKSSFKRNTKETRISVEIDLDGKGKYSVNTPVPFMNHMLTLFSKHGFFDLVVKAKGDTFIDDHHTVEDLGICLGQALKASMEKKQNLNRFGYAVVPMDESLSEVSVDLSGRPYLIFNVNFTRASVKKEFDFSLLEDFFRALVSNSSITLHINSKYGKNNHHIAESVFKAFARALSEAVRINTKAKGVPSTKGCI